MKLQFLIVLAGIGHIILALASLFVPRLLNWKSALANIPLLVRQIFWTYAGYILVINLFFGIISIAYTDQLLAGNDLSNAVLILIVLYWTIRIIIQFSYFDKKDIPQKPVFVIGEWLLIGLFVFFILSYGWALYNVL